jgi:1-phosphatidylinositol-5-phosphate 4-kinase
MHRVLKEYHQYVVERHANTLLPQYLGMYRVTINDSETYIVVMRNIFSPRLPIQRKYDLKGSTVARQASDKERAKDMPTFKDNDFLNDGQLIRVGTEKRDKLMATIQADTEFLSNLNLMDYSLLVGIHDCELAAANGASGDQQPRNNSFDNDLEEGDGADEDAEDDDSPGCGGGGGATGGGELTPPDSPVVMDQAPFFSGELDPSLEFYAVKCSEACVPPRNDIYFLAIVDILTHYGVKKRTAQAAKTVKHGAGAEISTVRPDQYAKRFLDFVEKIIE